MLRCEVIDAPPNRLGECPVWCDRTELLWWVDVLEGALWCHDPRTGRTTRHAVDARRLGSIALRQQGGLLLACDDGLHLYDPETSHQTFLLDPEPDRRGHRKNDGRADPYGNFWVGTLREADYAPVGQLYRVSAEGDVTIEARGLAIPNALAFHPERQRMYFADTRAHTIWACDYAGGQLGAREVFARTSPPARPDGSCIDAEGYVWNAEYAGGRLVRYHPSGTIERVVELPVSHPTCCCFGGPELDWLYVTSAAEPLTLPERDLEPLAGRVLALRPGVGGRPEMRVGL